MILLTFHSLLLCLFFRGERRRAYFSLKRGKCSELPESHRSKWYRVRINDIRRIKNDTVVRRAFAVRKMLGTRENRSRENCRPWIISPRLRRSNVTIPVHAVRISRGHLSWVAGWSCGGSGGGQASTEKKQRWGVGDRRREGWWR